MTKVTYVVAQIENRNQINEKIYFTCAGGRITLKAKGNDIFDADLGGIATAKHVDRLVNLYCDMKSGNKVIVIGTKFVV